MSDAVHIVEVGPRDGLQNEKTLISVADRISFIKALLGAGLSTIEVGAFVSPKAIPQMVGSSEVLRGVSHLGGEFHVLVPNEKGYDASQAAGAKVIAVFASAAPSMARSGRGRSSTSPGYYGISAATKSRSATPSASARR
jgi:hydroxymethylglutaryl-CoA lyase